MHHVANVMHSFCKQFHHIINKLQNGYCQNDHVKCWKMQSHENHHLKLPFFANVFSSSGLQWSQSIDTHAYFYDIFSEHDVKE